LQLADFVENPLAFRVEHDRRVLLVWRSPLWWWDLPSSVPLTALGVKWSGWGTPSFSKAERGPGAYAEGGRGYGGKT
jgi:hypothetical protein